MEFIFYSFIVLVTIYSVINYGVLTFDPQPPLKKNENKWKGFSPYVYLKPVGDAHPAGLSSIQPDLSK